MKAEITAEILSYTERPWTSKDGTAKVFREALVRSGSTVVKFPVSDTAGLAALEGREAVLTLEFYSFGNDVSAKCKIVSAVEPD